MLVWLQSLASQYLLRDLYLRPYFWHAQNLRLSALQLLQPAVTTSKPPPKTEIRAMCNVRSVSDISPTLWCVL